MLTICLKTSADECQRIGDYLPTRAACNATRQQYHCRRLSFDTLLWHVPSLQGLQQNAIIVHLLIVIIHTQRLSIIQWSIVIICWMLLLKICFDLNNYLSSILYIVSLESVLWPHCSAHLVAPAHDARYRQVALSSTRSLCQKRHRPLHYITWESLSVC